jgi:hypothetical protein
MANIESESMRLIVEDSGLCHQPVADAGALWILISRMSLLKHRY